MKRQLLLTALCCLAGATQAQTNSPDARGYLERGILMFEDRNYEGCIDQLSHLGTLHATPEQEEQALYYLGLASQGLGGDEALGLFRQFLEKYPVSPLRADVMMSVGDYYFNRGNYAQALQEYSQVNPIALTSSRCDDMTYRTAYSYMLLGEYQTAAGMFRSLPALAGLRQRRALLSRLYSLCQQGLHTGATIFPRGRHLTRARQRRPLLRSPGSFRTG